LPNLAYVSAIFVPGVELGVSSRYSIICLAVPVFLCATLAAGPNKKEILVKRPTIVAFFPMTDADLAKDSDANDALADFQFYAGTVRGLLDNMGIGFEEVYTTVFDIKCDGKTTKFRPKRGAAGYYLVAPGRAPRVEYGVMTNTDLLEIASAYFRPAAN